MTLPGTGGTVNFKYDPFGRRIEKIAPTTGTTIYAYDGDNMTEELGARRQPAGPLHARRRHRRAAGHVRGTGGTYFYHADGLGSITSLTDWLWPTRRQLRLRFVRQPHGFTGTITNPFQYTGREFDSETGLYYYRARYYDPHRQVPQRGPDPAWRERHELLCLCLQPPHQLCRSGWNGPAR